MLKPQRNKYWRISGIVLLSVLIAIGIGGLWLNGNYTRIIQKKLPELGQKATDSLYQIDAGDVDIDLIGRKVVITDFELIPDPEHIARLRLDYNLPKVLLKIHVDKITLEDIAWGKVLRTKEIVCGKMEILHPVVRVTKLTDNNPEDSTEEKKPSAIQAIKAGIISVLNPDVIYKDDKATAYVVKGGTITLKEWHYDLRQPADSSRLLYASSTALRLDNFFMQQGDAMYKISSGAIDYNQEQSTLSITNLRLKANASKDAFYRKTGFQKEMYDLDIPMLSISGLDWKGLLQRSELIATRAKLSDAAIGIYMSRIPPLNTQSKNGKFPQQMLMKLKMPVNISTLDITNGRFAYTELNEKTNKAGTIAMTRINGSVSNITNIPAKVRSNGTSVIKLKGDFKGSPIDATFRLKLASKTGAFDVQGSMGAMDGTRLNDITKPLALTEIKRLHIQEVQFAIAGDEAGAKGTLTMKYEALKADLMEVEGGRLDKKDVTSFLTNSLLVHAANPERGRQVRIARPIYARDTTKSFFNLIWKTMFTGMLQTVSRKAVKLDKVVNKRQKKQEEKRREAEQGK